MLERHVSAAALQQQAGSQTLQYTLTAPACGVRHLPVQAPAETGALLGAGLILEAITVQGST